MMRGELEQEIEDVRRKLLGRLAELEPLPEALGRSELKLQEAQERERSLERRSIELGTDLTDLRLKVTFHFPSLISTTMVPLRKAPVPSSCSVISIARVQFN